MKHILKLFIWFILYQPLKTLENRNSLTVAPNLFYIHLVHSIFIWFILYHLETMIIVARNSLFITW
jgi:hypothetical protein